MKTQTRIQQIQEILGVDPDNRWGPQSQKQFDIFAAVHRGKASSFADPADIKAFKKCKAQGKSDQECFAVGDNGEGKWGDDTTEGSGPSCAVPPEFWQVFKNPRKQKILVTYGDKSVVCELKDTMPRMSNRANEAIIDLNPDACKALGVKPPIFIDVTWQWI